MTRILDAIVLAGEREGSIPIHGGNKAFLTFRGRPLIAYVLDALERARNIGSITVVGPREKLERELRSFALAKPLHILEQGHNIFENIVNGALSTFPAYRAGAGFEELARSAEADKACAMFTCDMPLIDPREIDAFIATAPLDRADIVYGYTVHELLAPYEPAGERPGIKFIYGCLADRLVRHSNIAIYRPLKLSPVMREFVPMIYSLRYQRYLGNVARALAYLASHALRPRPLYLFVLLESAAYCHNHGLHRLRDLVRRPIELRWAEDIISELFQTRFATNSTIGPGLTLDVDDDPSFQAFLACFDQWREIQARQLEAASSLQP
jgi:molybdopterin-guanine dinucleotide biosynthesis protein A